MRVADAATGEVRNVLAERAETFFESGQGRVNWRYLPRIERSAVVLAQGRLGPPLPARRGHRLPEEPHHHRRRQRHAGAARRREGAHDLLPAASARRRAAIRTSGTSTRSASTARAQTLLTPEDGDHTIDLSPSGTYFVDTYSKPDVPPVIGAARRRTARSSCRSRRADISQLDGDGLEAADADHREGARRQDRPATACCSGRRTSIRRSGIRSSTTSIRVRRPAASAAAASRPRAATRRRSPSSASSSCRSTAWARRGARATFHEAYYGDMGDNTLPDQVAGMKELASRYPVDRSRSRRHLRPLRRRLRDGRRDVPVSRLLQGRRVAGRQSRQPRLRGRLGGEVAGPAREEAGRHQQLRRSGESECTRRT